MKWQMLYIGLLLLCLNGYSSAQSDDITLVCPSNQTREATAGVTFHQLTFPNPAVLPEGTYVTFRQSPRYFEVGTTRVTFIATDLGGSEYTCNFHVTLAVPDITPPSLICPGNYTVYLESSDHVAVENVTLPPPVHAVDNSGGIVSLFYDPGSGTRFFVGTTEVRLTASDPNQNSEYCTFFVIVKQPLDTTPPALTCPPDQTKPLPQDGSCYLLVEYPAPTATDDSGNDVIIDTYPSSGGLFDTCVNYDGMTILVVATDSSGNEATCSFDITWSDLTTMSAGTTRRPTTVGTTSRQTTTRPATTTKAPATTRPPTTTTQPTTTRPVTTRQPTTTQQPTTIRPITTTKAPTTTRPSPTTRQPTTTRPPTITRQPTTTLPPTTTRQPTTTRPPTTTTQPTTTRPPTTTRQPTTTRPPTTTTQPTTTRPPSTTTKPTTTRPSTTTILPSTKSPTTTKPTTTRPSTTTKAPSTTRPSTTTKPPSTTRPSTTTKSPSTTRPSTTTKSPTTTTRPPTTSKRATTTRPTTKPATTAPVKTTARKTTTKNSNFIDICIPNPCHNLGVCFRDTANTVINCVCQRGYLGDRCELSSTTPETGKELTNAGGIPGVQSSAIIGIIVGSLALVLVIFVMLTCIICCNNSGGNKKKTDPSLQEDGHLNPVFSLAPLDLDNDKQIAADGGGGTTESDEDVEDDYETAKNLLASVLRSTTPVEHAVGKSPAPLAPNKQEPAKPGILKPSIPVKTVKPIIPVKKVKPNIPIQHVKPTIPVVTHVDTSADDDTESNHSDHSYQSIDGATKRVVIVECHQPAEELKKSDPRLPSVTEDDDEELVRKIFETEGLVRIPSTLTNYSQMSLKISNNRMNNRYVQRV